MHNHFLMIDHKSLADWFNENKRNFPWRRKLSPYHVWVSEVMLQQTLAQVVIPYFERWISLFPTVEDLAWAPLEQVIKAWEGLGYYSRARNLHAGAKQIVEEYGGKLPDTFEKLRKIKGIGDYTAGAILSFAFEKKAPAVDGNVVRVISRLLAIEDDISLPKTVKTIRRRVEEILPDKKPWIVMEALIELGATVCRKKPDCLKCPLRTSCQAYFTGKELDLPYKSQKIRYEKLTRTVFVLKFGDEFLLKQALKGEIMQDLHEFPFVETPKRGWTAKQTEEFLQKTWGLRAETIHNLDPVKHTFTRFRVTLHPYIIETNAKQMIKGHRWLQTCELQTLAFSSGHRRILRQVLDSPHAV